MAPAGTPEPVTTAFRVALAATGVWLRVSSTRCGVTAWYRPVVTFWAAAAPAPVTTAPAARETATATTPIELRRTGDLLKIAAMQ